MMMQYVFYATVQQLIPVAIAYITGKNTFKNEFDRNIYWL